MAKAVRKPVKVASPREFVIDRDARFMRLIADDIFVVGRKDDLQLSVIEQGPRPAGVRPPQGMDASKAVGRGELGLEASWTEVVRLVISPRSAMTMALQVLDQSLARDWIELAEARELLEATLNRHDADDDEETTE